MRHRCVIFRSAARAYARAASWAVVVLVMCSAAAIAQRQEFSAPPQPVPPQPAQAQPAPQTEPAPPGQITPPPKPGFFDQFGHWVDQGLANFRRMNEKAEEDRRKFRENADEARRNATKATQEAFESMSRLPTSRVVTGRERCAQAANGAPDCLAAAEALCRKKGFKGGKSLEFTSAEECPARVLLSGRQSGAECKMVTFISRAMCQ